MWLFHTVFTHHLLVHPVPLLNVLTGVCSGKVKIRYTDKQFPLEMSNGKKYITVHNTKDRFQTLKSNIA